MKGAYSDWMIDLEVGTVIQFDNRAVFSGSPDPTWSDATVIDLLSTQFVAEYVGRERSFTRFLFYKDRDDTWRFKP